MTRSTRLAVTSPGVKPMDLWRIMATAICAPEQYRFTVSDTSISADMGQGLCALMDLDFAPDGEQIPAVTCAEEDFCESPCDGWLHDPAHYLMADFDTAYSFTDQCGCHSGGLHLRLLTKVGSWLTQRGATWRWYDESGDCWNVVGWGTLAGSACAEHRSMPEPVLTTPHHRHPG